MGNRGPSKAERAARYISDFIVDIGCVTPVTDDALSKLIDKLTGEEMYAVARLLENVVINSHHLGDVPNARARDIIRREKLIKKEFRHS